MQVGRLHNNTIVLCRDADELAYGCDYVVFVDSFAKEEYRVVDMNTPVTDSMKDERPLYYRYHQHGIKVIHFWAAIMGCDISENASGIVGVGRACFLAALKSFDEKPSSQLTSNNFAKAIRNKATTAVRASYSVKQIQDELDRVSKWFSKDGTYYDEQGNTFSVSGTLIEQATRKSIRHMNGELDPKTRQPYTTEQRNLIKSIQTHNLLHNSAADRATINGLSLPEGKQYVGQCTVDELKTMVVARSGSVTGKDGKSLNKAALQKLVRAYLFMEKENVAHTVYFDRTRNRNGVFAKIDTSQRMKIPAILRELLGSGDHGTSLSAFFQDVLQLHQENMFIEDFAKISLDAPEMTENFIQECFIHVGENTSQKNIVSGLHKVMEMDEILYHGFCWGPNNKSIYVISKQRASQSHDEKTRNKTPAGEKPLLAEYFVMAQIGVRQTTYASNGHTLGMCTHIMRSYCAQCKAGCGMCCHKSGALWMQYLHWGEGRPTPKPATASYCSWIPGSRAPRTCSTLLPACRTQMEHLPGSNKEAQEKLNRGVKKNMFQGMPARYDIYGGDEKKAAKLDDPHYTSTERCSKLFQCLRNARMKEEREEE